MRDRFDLLIVGAGPTGCVVAERAANVLGWRCLVIDKRSHIAGNCFDEVDGHGLWVHRYGPHFFRCDNPAIVEYLSRFTGWSDADYRVRSLVRGQEYPFPINLDTLEQYFGRHFTPAQAENFIEDLREPIEDPQNSEEFVVSRVGWQLYRDFYLEYTRKQWGCHPSELDASVCGRIPIRFNRDHRYTDASFQKLPSGGYTRLFANMLDHPLVTVELNTDFASVRGELKPRHATLYTGAMDDYFDHALGRLGWRSLEFEFRHFPGQFAQSCTQINYPDRRDYTRSVELKHVTGEVAPETVVSYEYPKSSGDPYYPVPSPGNHSLHRQYQAMAVRETELNHVYFCGRLAEYRYINMDIAIANALEMFDRITARYFISDS